jgi:hypothetical protein
MKLPHQPVSLQQHEKATWSLLLDPAQYDGLPLSVNVFTGVNKTTHD